MSLVDPIDDGSSMRSAGGRRRVWRAAGRATEEARDENSVGETQCEAEEAKWQEGEMIKRQDRTGWALPGGATLHIVLHFPVTATATATARAPAATATTAAAAPAAMTTGSFWTLCLQLP